jgi:hypothetical protein
MCDMRERHSSPAACPPGAARAFLVGIAFAAGAFASAAAHAQVDLQLIAPHVITWKDPVTARLTGTVPQGCGASAGDLQFSFSPPRIDIPFQVDCTLPLGGERQFVIDVALGRLDVRPWIVGVKSGAVVIDEVAFTVQPAGVVELELPAVARSDQPVVLLVHGYWSCPLWEGPTIVGNVITIEVYAECHILPPGPFTSALDVLLGPLPPGDYEIVVEDHALVQPTPGYVTGKLRVWDAQRCVPSDTTLCLGEGRFRVTATWEDFSGNAGEGHPIALPGNDTSGLLWFFSPDNAEITVKLLDGCGVNGRWWAFVSSSSTVEFDVAVTDTQSGVTRHFLNASNVAAPLMADTGAFTCP